MYTWVSSSQVLLLIHFARWYNLAIYYSLTMLFSLMIIIFKGFQYFAKGKPIDVSDGSNPFNFSFLAMLRL